MRSRMAPIALTAVMLGGGMAAATAATADTGSGSARPAAQIQSCYGSAKNYTAIGSGSTAVWPAGTAWAKATSHCADINIKVNYNRHVKVCFRSGCPANFQYAKKGQWKVLAQRVPNGKEFFLEFSGGNNGTGQVAY